MSDKVSLFLGCLIPNRYPGIEKATQLCFEKLDIDCADLVGASCCPAPGVFRSFDEPAWLAITSRNIVLSEEMERDVLTLCNGCYGSLAEANNKLKESSKLKEMTNEHLSKIGKEYKGSIDVRHITEFLFREIGVETIKLNVTNPLGLKVAVHYGCHLLKPSRGREFESIERPTFFDAIVEATGCESVDYPDKMECCGAGGGVRSGLSESALSITNHKLSRIKEADVDCIINACPFCHLQFDDGQREIKEKGGNDYGIPVLHFTQLLALAFGHSPEDVGLQFNATDCSSLQKKLPSED
ncbi:heterodisulfide reductase subunit B [Methanohalophilus levihalophilus]|uniref:CoB--CoM heterodisulfide reductase subunit B n=1 Tax=Methanohalophilus levihalophilus TaxID=1431282 RepID=UPI001AE92DF3|nr:CoB--CoM heterodisulfide reductase subunit B [Methanohalophilus levihalophilus]MBP2030748.1 heterodisulfide reductase subunit B [Methanohalophilus levihalophilus]